MSLMHPPAAQTHPHLLRNDSYGAGQPQLPPEASHNIPLRHSRMHHYGPQHPMLYAHPLAQRTDSFDHIPEAGGHGMQQHHHSAEHMLRRKTPNGVLSAAYDGTATSTIDRPHAMKHIILPVAEQQYQSPLNLAGQPHLAASVSSPGHKHISELDVIKSESHPYNQVWDPGVQGGFAPDGWMSVKNEPQIDSMLHQIPMQQLANFQHGGDYYGFMQASITPSGPTISNSMGPYGPYWPNGDFQPYRLAAMQDPRYQPQYSATWLTPTLSTGFVASLDGAMGSRPMNHQLLMQPANEFGIAKPQFQMTFSPNTVPTDLGYQPALFDNALPIDYFASPMSAADSSGDSTPRAAQTPVPSDFAHHSNSANRRESVFTWAHSVYVNLLEYLKHTRHTASNNRHMPGYHHAQRPNIYPKPPRQQNYDFQTHMNMRKAGARGLASRPQQVHAVAAPAPMSFKNRSLGAAGPWPSQLGQDSMTPPPKQPNWQTAVAAGAAQYGAPAGRVNALRHNSGVPPAPTAQLHTPMRREQSPAATAILALDSLQDLCQKSNWKWVEGMLLGGCLAYALSDYAKAMRWYSAILEIDATHVEAISNLAATYLAVNRKQDAETNWLKAVKLRPGYFEAVEHLVGLLCGDHRGKDAVGIIDFVERSLFLPKAIDALHGLDRMSDRSSSTGRSPSLSEASDRPLFEYDGDGELTFTSLKNLPGSDQPGFGSSGYAIPGSDNGRMLQLVHAKGNMLYAMGDNAGAAKAFECAVLISTGRRVQGVEGLIKHILEKVTPPEDQQSNPSGRPRSPSDPVLLPPDSALRTARACFPGESGLPGLKDLSPDERVRKAAMSTTSNSLLSLAKIFQDGMASNSPKANAYQTKYGVRDILALYYLSLSLQPSPSTANNVGILLASVQQIVAPSQLIVNDPTLPKVPNVVPGSGVALALAYYNYGLNLDSRHAHLYTNLGSLLKDIGQLHAAIKMYEQAVQCDGNFDIALANLANAVKDQNRIADAITYYRRAVQASPDFAEAVCGLANALNSVCGWQGRGGVAADGGKRDRWHVNEKGYLLDSALPGAVSSGWIKRVVDLVEKQLADGEEWGRGSINAKFVARITRALPTLARNDSDLKALEESVKSALGTWSGQKWEGARLIRMAERVARRLGWQWYQDRYVKLKDRPASAYARPQIPPSLTVPAAPTVLPFHTFTCPMSAKQIRLISQRNGLRISCSTLKAPWLPQIVYQPPAPPAPYLKVGYVSSDFNNHPLAHLMQSVFGMHDRRRVEAYCYATTASDNSVHRQQIEREAPVFRDASSWPAERLVNQIVRDGIHILVNLNGYTRGARNEVFAARPAPIHMSFMGFAGTLGAEWCDYLLADETAVPPSTLRPWRRNVDVADQLRDENSGSDEDGWVYGENVIYCRDTFFCCDHKQSAADAKGEQLGWEAEQLRRWRMRKELFPQLPDDTIILGNFNQLYKIEPTTFRTWLRILARLPKAILWLLRFPDLGETHLRATAELWAGPEVARRVMFTDVAPKAQHIARARVCDLFLDTPECNAHTTAADVLWSGTPLLTLPRYDYKMCSRMAASILRGACPRTPEGERAYRELTVRDEDEYEELAVKLARGCRYEGHRARGRLAELRKLLYEGRWEAPLFDTRRWVRDLETAYERAWARWVRGEGGDIWLED